MEIEEQREHLAERIMQAKKKNIELKLKMKPIKFSLGSWFEYNNKIYVLIGDNNGDPIFEKLSEFPQWIIDLDNEVKDEKCPYGEFTGICDITGKPCKDTVMCNLETVYVEEGKDNESEEE